MANSRTIVLLGQMFFIYRSHVEASNRLRGNASRDAPRSSSGRDAERPGLHSHAERGNDQSGGKTRRS
ncbi:hypothetical protein C1X57_04520 [Pseudomonas sp. FW215-E1]|nr:hypothetical protein C1X57_04520 [Pseudomonas sp. FW215-E1]